VGKVFSNILTLDLVAVFGKTLSFAGNYVMQWHNQQQLSGQLPRGSRILLALISEQQIRKYGVTLHLPRMLRIHRSKSFEVFGEN
jgi:hypothetical protein